MIRRQFCPSPWHDALMADVRKLHAMGVELSRAIATAAELYRISKGEVRGLLIWDGIRRVG